MRFEKVSLENFRNDIAAQPQYHYESGGTIWDPVRIDRVQTEEVLASLKLPQRQTAGSAGFDFYLPSGVIFPPKRTTIVPTGVCCNLDPQTVLLVVIRSSAAIKRGLQLVNAIGVIDSDYYGNPDNGGDIILAIHNSSNEAVAYPAGDRIAQGIVVPCSIGADTFPLPAIERLGGIGSTGGVSANDN